MLLAYTLPRHPLLAASNGGDGDGASARLAAIESRLIEVEKGVIEVKTEIKHLATKEDIQKLKVWVLVGVLVATSTVAIVTTGVIKLFFSN